MKITRLSKEGFTIPSSGTLRDALITITNNHKGATIITDSNDRLLGVVSDGDIRRAIIKGATEHTPLEKFLNLDPKYLPDTATEEEIIEMFKKFPGITFLPLLNSDNRVTQVAYPEIS